MMVKSQSNYRLRFRWPLLGLLFSFVAIAPVHSEQFHYNKSGGVILPSRHSDPFTKFVEDTIKHVVETGIDQVKSIVSGTKNLVTAGGQIIASALAYATGNKELGDKLANDAASSAKHLGDDVTDLLSSGGNLYNKTAEDLNEVVPHLGTLAGMLVSLTPIGPEVSLARGFADVKNAFEKGGINAALQAAAFAALDVAPGGAGKAAKAAKEARAAENMAGDLARLSALFKQAGKEAKVANDATKLNKFLDYVDKINKLARPKDAVPGRDRDNDGKLQGSGGSNWENRRDALRKKTGYDEQVAKDKAAPAQVAKNPPPEPQRPTRNAEPRSVRPQGRTRLDSVEADVPAPPHRDVVQEPEPSGEELKADQHAGELAKLKADEDARELAATKKAIRDARDRTAKMKAEQDARDLEARIKADRDARDLADKRQAELDRRNQLAEKQRRDQEAKQQQLEEERRNQIAEKQRLDREAKQQQLEEEKRNQLADKQRQEELAKQQQLEEMQLNKKAEEEFRAAKEKDQQAEQQSGENAQLQRTHTENEEVQAQKEYLDKLHSEQPESEQAAPQNAKALDQMQAPHTEDEEVQAQKEYLEKLRSDKQPSAGQSQKQSNDDADTDDQNN